MLPAAALTARARARIGGIHQQRGLTAGLRQRRAIGGHDGRPARHRLQARQAEALVARGEHEGLRPGVQGGQVAVLHVAE